VTPYLLMLTAKLNTNIWKGGEQLQLPKYFNLRQYKKTKPE